MSVKVKETSKAGTIALVDGVYGTLFDNKFKPYTEQELENKSAYRDNFGWVDYESIDDYFEKSELSKRKQIEERSLQRARYNHIINNTELYKADEIYKAAMFVNKEQPSTGWRAADALLRTNDFSVSLLKKCKSYTVTPFDNGDLLIKVDGVRYGNNRKWKNIFDLINS